MAWLRRGKLRWLLAVGALALLVSLAAVLAIREPAAAGGGLAEARERWAANGPARYRLSLTQQTRDAHTGAVGLCEQEMVADGEQVTAVRNTCGIPATWTVPRLLNWIAELEHEESRCYPDPSMCACQGSNTTAVRYDEALGYPHEVIYEWRKRPNLMNAAYWRSLLDRSFPGCDKDGRGGPVVYTVSLTEEP